MMPYSAEAKHGHACLQVVLKVFVKVSALCPAMVLSIENPVGKFRELPVVQRLAAKTGWFLLDRADHCMSVDPALDGERIFPKKPTSYLLYNVDQPVRQSLQRCNRACRCRVSPTSSRHRLLCCNRKNRPADQTVIRSSVQQGLILRVVFKSVFERRVRVPNLSCAQSFCANVCGALPGVGATAVVPLVERPLERTELGQAELWHQRLGHASARRLRGCARVARGVPASLAEHKSCTASKMCKQKAKLRSREASHRLFTAAKLSQVSVDLHGPYAQASRGGSKYVAVFVDAATSYTWVD